MKTFTEKYIAGEITDDQLDNKIDLWHTGVSGGQSLHEFLGMTWEEYKRWVLNPDPKAWADEDKKRSVARSRKTSKGNS